MKEIEKGEFGYLGYKKRLNLIITIAAFVVVAAVLVIGLLIFKTKNNYMTVAAIVLVLPAAKLTIGYLVLLGHESCTDETAEMLKKISGELPVVYDLVVSNSKKPIGVQAAAISATMIIAYSTDPKADKALFETSIKEYLKNEKLTAAVMLYNDRDAFLSKVKNVAADFDSSSEKCTDRAGYIRSALLRMSM